jgi:urea transport system permease protein
MRPWLCALIVLAFAGRAFAFDRDIAARLTADDSDVRVEALDQVMASGDAAAIPFLEQLLDGTVKQSGDRLFIVTDGAARDAVTGEAADLPADADDVVSSNRLRNALERALSALRLVSDDPATRRAAALALADGDVDPALLPLVQKAEQRESHPDIRTLLAEIQAMGQLADPDRDTRLAAIHTLGESANPAIKALLAGRLSADGEADPAEKAALSAASAAVAARLSRYERVGQVFTGISLGSILLLAALGLAITYGLMGVINMAHGELMMIGAYATYGVQTLFRALPEACFPYYLLAALPVAFAVTALVGMAIERLVLRHLYGRSLETLLATWGVSLILMQAVRTLFGAQNVSVENPSWMSGSLVLAPSLSLPWNRLVIIAFSGLVLAFMGWLLTRTRLGLFVRAVTQNRPMARCVGVSTDRVDMLAFGLGSGIAGLAGVALAQIGNVGPDLGQHYIVNSFMVVVLGGVGQLAGTVLAALGLGIVSKFLEGVTGAVIAEIIVLLFVVVFIQRRPQGLFAMTGRSAEM